MVPSAFLILEQVECRKQLLEEILVTKMGLWRFLSSPIQDAKFLERGGFFAPPLDSLCPFVDKGSV